jgi:hypothetical protein
MNKLILGESKLGKAVFANKDFKKGEDIIDFKGQLMKRKELPEIVNPEDDRYIQVGKDKYLGPSGDFDDFFNHSCDPNSGIKIIGDRVVLFAIKKIKKDEEITWDYSTTMDEDEWEMDCMCKCKNCRKRIRDFKYLPKEIQQKYIRLEIVPEYIKESLLQISPGLF